MTKLLLDFPWPIESLLDRYSESFIILSGFEELCDDEKLERVRFVDSVTFDAFCLIAYGQSRSDVVQFHMQVLPRYVRKQGGIARAFPVAGPHDRAESWYFALRDELLDDWRSPHIIASIDRREDWRESLVGPEGATEARITCQDVDGEYQRVFAYLESYSTHKHAKSDGDPWDLRRTRIHDDLKPCCLPKPVELNGVPFENLNLHLDAVQHSGWRSTDSRGDLYRFIPPADWDPSDWQSEETKTTCRNNGAFRQSTTPDGRHKGPVDFEDRIWSWDIREFHWDVQLVAGGYLRISHTGRLL
jgi:hypothetical protein